MSGPHRPANHWTRAAHATARAARDERELFDATRDPQALRRARHTHARARRLNRFARNAAPERR